MPFQSEKQRRYLHANHPEIAKRWERDYANGGILDINASEEIISDDGNDIELTAYNAAFDDPNDLSTGVKSLFKAKEGGNVRLGPHTATDLLAKKNPDGTRSKYQPPGGGDKGMTSSGGGPSQGTGGSTGWGGPEQKTDKGGEVRSGPADWGQQERAEKEIAKGKSHVTGDDTGAYKGKSAAEMKSLSQASPSHGGLDTEWSQSKEYEDAGFKTVEQQEAQRVKNTNIRIQKEIKEKWKHKINPTLWEQIKSLPTFDFLGIVTAIAKDLYDVHEIKKDMALLESLGLHKGHPSGTNTAYSQLQNYLNQRKFARKDEDDKGDGPELPQVVPIGEEIEAYEDVYAMSPWDRIKANQAKRAMLVEKRIIQDSPIVGESVTDITMQANRGGLANLFRVKNQ